VIRELARLASLGLEPGQCAWAFLGGAVGGALAYVGVRVVDDRWPALLDPIRPH
jgi:hypothetical protein